MLNKLLNLTEKGKHLFAPCLCPVQASWLSMSRFILIEINIHISVIITSGQEAFKVGKTATKCYPNTVSKYYDPVYFISDCSLENLSYLQTLLICSNKWNLDQQRFAINVVSTGDYIISHHVELSLHDIRISW